MNQTKTVIIIEDEPLHAEMYATMFDQEGFLSRIIANGEEAVSWFDTITPDQVPDAILLDVILPGFSGLSVLEHIRSNPLIKRVPVVVATNLSIEEIREKATALGASAFVLKAETTPKDIVEKVKKLLDAGHEQFNGAVRHRV